VASQWARTNLLRSKTIESTRTLIWLFATPLIVGIIIRLVFAQHIYSFENTWNWFRISNKLHDVGLDQVYLLYHRVYLYPPLWAYILYAIGLVQPQTPNLSYLLLLKTPIIIGDVLTYLMIVRLTLDVTQDLKAALIGGIIWFLNPMVIWVTSFFAMFDSLCSMFMLLGLFLLARKKLVWGGIAFGLALSTKQYALLPFVTILTYLVCTQGGLRASKFFASSTIPLGVLSIPFIVNPRIFPVFVKALVYGGPSQFDSRFNYAVWRTLLPLNHAGIIPDLIFNPLVYYAFYSMIFIPSIYYITQKLRGRKMKYNIEVLLNAVCISAFVFVLFSPQVCDNYFIMPIAFLAPTMVFSKRPTRIVTLVAYTGLGILYLISHFVYIDRAIWAMRFDVMFVFNTIPLFPSVTKHNP